MATLISCAHSAGKAAPGFWVSGLSCEFPVNLGCGEIVGTWAASGR